MAATLLRFGALRRAGSAVGLPPLLGAAILPRHASLLGAAVIPRHAPPPPPAAAAVACRSFTTTTAGETKRVKEAGDVSPETNIEWIHWQGVKVTLTNVATTLAAVVGYMIHLVSKADDARVKLMMADTEVVLLDEDIEWRQVCRESAQSSLIDMWEEFKKVKISFLYKATYFEAYQYLELNALCICKVNCCLINLAGFVVEYLVRFVIRVLSYHLWTA